jgi:hypothetical protein
MSSPAPSLDLNDPPASAPQVAGITDVGHHMKCEALVLLSYTSLTCKLILIYYYSAFRNTSDGPVYDKYSCTRSLCFKNRYNIATLWIPVLLPLKLFKVV